MAKFAALPAIAIALVAAALSVSTLGCTPSTPESRDEPARNVVLISIDAVGAKHVGAYGAERDTTPNLDRLATGGTLFEAAYTQQGWTLSSHITMMLGLNPHAHGASERTDAVRDVPTLAEVLVQHGFETAAFVGTKGYIRPLFGLGRGFVSYQVGTNDAEHDNVARLEWLREQSRRRASDPKHRFFLFAHFFDAHSKHQGDVPYHVPSGDERRFVGADFAWSRKGATDTLRDMMLSGDFDAHDQEVLTALYQGTVHHVDTRGVGPILDVLRETGMAEETLIVVTADHGEELFEHGKAIHWQPYDEVARVPLIFNGPGVPAGGRVASLVGLVDLAPTILSLLGFSVPPGIQGLDLSPLLREPGGRPLRSEVFVDGLYGGPWNLMKRTPSAIVADREGARWSYVNTVHDRLKYGARDFETKSAGELYHLDSDPGELRDVGDAHPALREQLRSTLLDWYRANELMLQRFGGNSGAASLLSDEEIRELEALGYVR